MELKLKNRDYCPDGAGGLERGEGAQAVLARVLFRLTARRGALPFLPELGSRLHEVLREKPSARLAAARQYVAQALEQEDVFRAAELRSFDELVGDFYRLVYGQEISEEEMAVMQEIGAKAGVVDEAH